MTEEGNITIKQISTEWEVANAGGLKIHVKISAGGKIYVYPIPGGERCIDMSDGGFVFKNINPARVELIAELIKRAANLPKLTD